MYRAAGWLAVRQEIFSCRFWVCPEIDFGPCVLFTLS